MESELQEVPGSRFDVDRETNFQPSTGAGEFGEGEHGVLGTGAGDTGDVGDTSALEEG